MAHAEPLALALLGAGCSARFGPADKLIAPLCGRPLLAWAAAAGWMLPAEWHLLVTGVDTSLAAAAPGYRLLVNADADQGLSSSLRVAAMEAGRLGAAALVVMLGDMPFVRPAHLHQLVAAFGVDDSRPVFSQMQHGAPCPPALFPAACFEALKTQAGDRGARALAFGAQLITAPDWTLVDIDTPEDVAHAATTWERQHDKG
ncbi:MAG TPA: nucleotidyltransferase family protein [Sphingobium sp.]|nr:nucleotidyltransferase family protein [Sphingobium sp.]